VCRVITVPAAERDRERLGDQIVTGVPAEPPGNVAVQRGRMPVKQQREALGLLPGPADQHRIAYGIS
jgi:hypothetical protein